MPYPVILPRRPRRASASFTYTDPPLRDRSYSWNAHTEGRAVYTIDSPPGPSNYNVTQTRTAVRSGVRLPNWREIIDRGENATTSLSATYDSIWYQFGTARFVMQYKLAPFNRWEETVIGALPVANGQLNRKVKAPTISTSFCDNQARAKFYKKLRKEAVQMSGPTFLGELQEALHMLRRPAGALYGHARDYSKAIQRAKKSDPKNWRQKLSGLWLEYSFGWVPLISDCQDAVKAWTRLGEKRPGKPISVSFQAYYDTHADPNFDNATLAIGSMPHAYVHTEAYASETHTVRYKGVLKPQAEMTKWDDWSLFGFTPSEFIPTAWELLPWSFLVDYFTNIGDILTSSVTDTSRVLWVNKTVRQETIYRGRMTCDAARLRAAFNSNWDTSVSGNPGAFELKRKVITRSANSGISLPRFQFDFNLSDGQLGNIAALIGQMNTVHPQNLRQRR